jgi:preprotein translocase subunit SecA
MKSGWVLYASDDSAEAVEEAREYIRAHGLTRDDVKLVKRDGQVLVIAERKVEP